MSELSGEKIEELLWAEGCEIAHHEGIEGFTSFSTEVGESVIRVSETWFEDGMWYVDSDTLSVERIIEGEKIDEDLTIPDDEQDLVDIILRLGGGV